MNLPIFPERRISFSGAQSLIDCPKKYFLSGPGAWNGWYQNAQERCKEIYLWKSTQGIYSWVGKLFHEWTTLVDYSDIDRALGFEATKSLSMCDDKLKQFFFQKLRAEWEDSQNLTLKAWQKLPTAERKKRLFLLQHARKLGPAESISFRKISTWIRPSIDNYLAHRGEYLGTNNLNDLVIIEGRQVRGGLIQDSNGQSQSALRKERAHPFHELEVDKEIWKFGYDIDRLIKTTVSGKPAYIFLDFKTGKPKESHALQLFIYAALTWLDYPEIQNYPLFGRLCYTNQAPPDGIQQFEIGPRERKEGIKYVQNAISLLKKHLVRVRKIGNQAAYKTLPISLRISLLDPNDFVFLEENFPPTAAENLKVSTCLFCDQIALCPEGTRLVSVSRS